LSNGTGQSSKYSPANRLGEQAIVARLGAWLELGGQIQKKGREKVQEENRVGESKGNSTSFFHFCNGFKRIHRVIALTADLPMGKAVRASVQPFEWIIVMTLADRSLSRKCD
jgi:hypothetical protein